MRCPNCSLVISNKKDICPQCLSDLRPLKQSLGLPVTDAKASVEELRAAITPLTSTPPPQPAATTGPKGDSWLSRLLAPKNENKPKQDGFPPALDDRAPTMGCVHPAATPTTPLAPPKPRAVPKAPDLSDTGFSIDDSLLKSTFAERDSEKENLAEDNGLDSLQLMESENPLDLPAIDSPSTKQGESASSAPAGGSIVGLSVATPETPQLDEEELDLLFSKINEACQTTAETDGGSVPNAAPAKGDSLFGAPASPTVLEFSDDDEAFHKTLDELIGEEVFEVSAVKKPEAPPPGPARSGSDDDLEISFEIELDDQEVDLTPPHEPKGASPAEDPYGDVLAALEQELAALESPKLDAPVPPPVPSAQREEAAPVLPLAAQPGLSLDERQLLEELLALTAEAYGIPLDVLRQSGAAALAVPAEEKGSELALLESELEAELSALKSEGTSFYHEGPIEPRQLMPSAPTPDVPTPPTAVETSEAAATDPTPFSAADTERVLELPVSEFPSPLAAETEPVLDLPLEFDEQKESNAEELLPLPAMFETEQTAVDRELPVAEESAPFISSGVAPQLSALSTTEEELPVLLPLESSVPEPVPPEDTPIRRESLLLDESPAIAADEEPSDGALAIWAEVEEEIRGLENKRPEVEIGLHEMLNFQASPKTDLLFELTDEEIAHPERRPQYDDFTLSPQPPKIDTTELEENVAGIIKEAAAQPRRRSAPKVEPAIVLPEPVPAPRWRRTVGLAIDSIIAVGSGVLLTVFFTAPPIAREKIVHLEPLALEEMIPLASAFLTFTFAAWLLLGWLFIGARGQTIGQHLTRVRVVELGERDVSFALALLRVFSQLTTVFSLGLGVLPIFGSSRRTLHDRMSMTEVVTASSCYR